MRFGTRKERTVSLVWEARCDSTRNVKTSTPGTMAIDVSHQFRGRRESTYPSEALAFDGCPKKSLSSCTHVYQLAYMMFEAQEKQTLESDRSRKSPVATQVVICQRRVRKGRDVGSVWWERGRERGCWLP